jgi:hypothetical protein
MVDDRRDIIRLLVTGFIWLMVGIIGVLSIAIPGEMTSGAVIVTALGLIFAYATTRNIWQVEARTTRSERTRERIYEKPKRGAGETKADLLLSLMDDDEREAFKRALQERVLRGTSRLADDGEIETDSVTLETLEALLAEQDRD